MKCSAYVPEIRFLQFYDSDLYYIIKVNGAPTLFREAKDGTRTALGKLPDGEDLRYAIHRHRFYLFDLSDKGAPCSVKRVRLDHFGWYTEDVVILEDAHTIEPKLFAADLCLFIEKQDGSQELRSVDLLTLEQTCFLENTDPTVRYRFSDLDAYHITLLQNKVKNGKIIDTEIWHLRRESGAFSYSLPQTSFLELGEITLIADVPIGFLCLHKTADGTIFRFEPDSAIDPPYEPFFLPVESPTVYRQDAETLVIVSPDGRIFRYRNGGMLRLR